MSATGLVARVAVGEVGADGASGTYPERSLVPPAGDLARSPHDVIAAAARVTVRGTIGVVTSAGRLVKVNVLEIPALPPGAGAVSLAGGTPVAEFAVLERGETVVGLCPVNGAGVALGTAEGVVKRVLPDYPQNRDEFELITLRAGDRVVGAAQVDSEAAELVFITSDAQLLHFQASSVRPQGRAAGGMAGARLSAGASVVWFGVVDAAAAAGVPVGPPGSYSPAVVVTVAGRAGVLPGTAAASVKVTPLHEFPGKGRAAGGMAGVRLSAGASVVWFGAVDAAAAAGVPAGPPGSYSPAVVVTVAGRAGALPGTAAASVKVTPLHEFPGKGRGTGGVRCHRFLKGEDVLVMAWAGPAPAAGATDAGRPVDLPDPVGKRDGSGVALRRQLAVIGGAGRVP